MLTRDDFRWYQPPAVQHIIDVPKNAMWLPMRSGKTAVTLTAFNDLRHDFEARKMLVVAPLRVSINAWPEDPRNWSHLQDLQVQLIRGTPTERLKQMNSKAPVHVINRELFVWLVNECLKRRVWPYDMLVLDEARSFKNHQKRTKSKNFTRFGAAAQICGRCSRIVELTGTPAPKDYMDLWAQAYLLDRGERLGRTITKFRKQFWVPGREHYNWEIREGAQKEIREKLKDLVFSIDADELNMEKLYNPVWVDLPTSSRKQYNELARKAVLEIEGGAVVSPNKGVATGKLAQFANGAVYLTPEEDEIQTGPKQWVAVHDEKLAAMDEVLEQIGSQPVFVAYEFRSDLARLRERYPWMEVLDSDPNTVKRWNRGEIRGLLAHPASAGHGLTMWQGGSHIIWYGITWDRELYDQFNERLSHPEKGTPTTVHQLLTRDTVDEEKLLSLAGKFANQRELILFMVANIKKRLGL